MQAGARCALLAGSGSSVFGIFENEDVLSVAANALARGKRLADLLLCYSVARRILARDGFCYLLGVLTKDSDTGA